MFMCEMFLKIVISIYVCVYVVIKFLINKHRHIDCNRVPFSIGFDSITSEIFVNALSDRYTHWSSVHNKKRHSCIGNETETYENQN